jgi:2-C-methyl-D-erythritol 4-phosphate cytidylyltransferase
MKFYAIIPAAGTGSRYSKDKNKLLEEIFDIPVIIHTLNKIASVTEIEGIIICTSSALIEDIKELVSDYKISKVKAIILGGKERQESVFLGLQKAKEYNPDYVLIHDAARPLVSQEIIENSLNMAVEKGACIVAVPTKDTIKRVSSKTGEVIETVDRSQLWNVQTPQIFKFSQIIEAHERFAGQNFTDDAALLEELNLPVNVCMGSYKNIKITTSEDLKISQVLWEEEK